MRDDVYEEMFRIEDTHWWYVSKQRIVAGLIERYARRRDSEIRLSIADLGCGCGAMLNRLKAAHDVVGVDPSPLAIQFCAKRGIAVMQGSFPNEIPLQSDSFDVVLLLDVIEHLQDDYAGLRTAARLLKPGGVVMITVPAYQWLWSDWDEIHHHFRRYSRKSLRGVLDAANLKIELLSYANTTLFPLAAAARMVQRGRGKKHESAGMDIPSPMVNGLFRTIYSSERHLLGRVPLPFGLSVVAVARRM